MGETYCINCGKKSSEPFKFCSDCGHEFGKAIGTGRQKSRPSSNQPLRFGTKIWLFTLFCTIILGLISLFEKKSPVHEKIEDGQDAHYYGTVFIRRQLKAPKTAEFGSTYDCTTILTNPEKRLWTSSCYVDAQNSFGALIRSNYWVTVQYDKQNDKWVYIDSEIK